MAVQGPADAELLVIGWGGTYGSIATAVQRCQRKGLKVAQAHLRYLNPMPKNTAEVLGRFKKILVPELNSGQLLWLLRAKYLAPAEGLNKVQGRPFLVQRDRGRDREDVRLMPRKPTDGRPWALFHHHTTYIPIIPCPRRLPCRR